MASHPDTSPDLPPDGTPDAGEQVPSPGAGGRESIEDTPGTEGGTSGTGGEITQDEAFER